MHESLRRWGKGKRQQITHILVTKIPLLSAAAFVCERSHIRTVTGIVTAAHGFS